MVKSTKGRQRLEMVRIQKECNRLVTYSKRRAGIFKKASELATLCGAEIAIIVFSPGEKAISFGTPSIENVLDRYLNGGVHPPRTSAMKLVQAHRNAVSEELNVQLTQVLEEVEREKKHGQELDRISRESQRHRWWETPVQEMNLARLEQLKAALLELRLNVKEQAEKIVLLHAAHAQQTIPANVFAPNRNAAAAMAFAQGQHDAASFPPGLNAANFPADPNNVFPPSPNLNARFCEFNQPPARMFHNEAGPSGFGNNGSF